MKKLLIILLLGIGLTTKAQWLEDSTGTTGGFYKINAYNLRGFGNSSIITLPNGNIIRGGWQFGDSSRAFYMAGKVGIGTILPANNLHVFSTSSAGGISVDGNNNPAFSIFNSGLRKGFWSVTNINGGYFRDALAGDMTYRSENVGGRMLFGFGTGLTYSTISMDSISLKVGSNRLVTSTILPYYLSMGATYDSIPGTNLKLRLFEDTTGLNTYGLSVSSNQLDYVTPLARRHAFYNGSTLRMAIDSFGIRFPSTNISYLNFGATSGAAGFGIRNNFGVIEYKSSSGSWAAIGSGTGGGGSGGDVYLANANNFTNVNTITSSSVQPFTVTGTGAYMRIALNHPTNTGMFFSINGRNIWQIPVYGSTFAINNVTNGLNLVEFDTLANTTRFPQLAGTGTRMATVSSTGVLGSQTIPSGGGTATDTTSLSNRINNAYNDVSFASDSSAFTLIKPNGNNKTVTFVGGSGGSGSSGSGGTLTNLTVGNNSPLFTTTVTNATTSPVVTFNSLNQSPNSVFAGPVSGGAATPTFRALVAADIPSHNHAASDIISGIIATARLGTGTANSTTYLRGDNTWATPTTNNGTVTSVSATVPPGLSVSTSNSTTTPLIAISASFAASQLLTANSSGNGFATLSGANGAYLKMVAGVPTWISDSASTPIDGTLQSTAGVLGVAPGASSVLYKSITITSSTYTVAAGIATIFCNYTGGTLNITMPTASSNIDRRITIKNYSANNVVMNGTNSADANTEVQGNSFTYQSDGTNWNLIMF